MVPDPAVGFWNALIEAEEYGITQENVDQVKKTSTNPNVQRLVGSGEDMGKLLGLDKDWSYRIVKQVGNYGESFEKESWTEDSACSSARC